jgi:hypothetical protein
MQLAVPADMKTVIGRGKLIGATRRGEKMAKRFGLVAWALPLAAAALVAAFATSDPADLPYFAHAARTLFSAHWADTFADPSLQVGPLQLFVVGVADRLGGLGLLAFLLELGLVALTVFTVGRLLQGRPHRAAVQTVAGLAVVVLGITDAAYTYGHPAQVAIPLLWVLAAVDAREGKTIRAGALLGLSAGFEVWGVLGLPVLLLAPGLRTALRGLAAQAAVTGALFLPFALFGEFRMFEHAWRVEGWTLVRFVVPAGSEFPWGRGGARAAPDGSRPVGRPARRRRGADPARSDRLLVVLARARDAGAARRSRACHQREDALVSSRPGSGRPQVRASVSLLHMYLTGRWP